MRNKNRHWLLLLIPLFLLSMFICVAGYVYAIRDTVQDTPVPVPTPIIDVPIPRVPAAPLSPDTFTSQDAVVDTWLNEQQPTTNYGSDTYLWVYDRSDRQARSILEFDISSIPADATITDAEFKLYYYYTISSANASGKVLEVYKLDRVDWVEAEATWNIDKTGSNWTAAGGDYVIDPVGANATCTGNYGWISWNVTTLAAEAVVGETDLELLVKYFDETIVANYTVLYLYSANASDNTTLQPYLSIEYTLATGWGGKVDGVDSPTKVDGVENFTIINGVSADIGSLWGEWFDLATIYYNPAQESANNTYLADAATELETWCEAITENSWSVNTTDQPDLGIFLSVDATLPHLSALNDEAVNVYTSTDGIHVIGKTAIAARNGAYFLLEKMGMRWLGKHTAWTVTPTVATSIGSFNTTYAPDLIYRHQDHEYQDNITMLNDWERRNMALGNVFLPSSHNYDEVADPDTYYATYPEWYSGNVTAGAWQLDPAAGGNATSAAILIDRSANYTVEYQADGDGLIEVQYSTGDIIEKGGPSYSPNDGAGWAPSYNETDTANITNVVFDLLNKVAANISVSYPDIYINTTSYYLHAGIPDFALEPNIMVHVTDGYNWTPNSTKDRYEGLAAKGVGMGTYSYLAEWDYNQERPSPWVNYEKLYLNDYYHTSGNITKYSTHVSDSWAAQGLMMWLIAKLTWDCEADPDVLIDDYMTKAFSPAKDSMASYYDVRGTDNYSLKMAFNYLAQAETDAVGNDAVLARIRHLQLHAYVSWKFHNIGIENLPDGELEDFYTMCSNLRNLFIIYPKYMIWSNTKGVKVELLDREYSEEDITALLDYTEPSTANVTTWFNEGLDYFNALGSTQVIPTTNNMNPRRMTLVALGDNDTADEDPMYTGEQFILIPSEGSENVTIMVKGTGYLKWYNPDSLWCDIQLASDIDNWVEYNFEADEAGTYIFATARSRLQAFIGWVDVPGRPAAMFAANDIEIFSYDESISQHAPKYWWENSTYFYVPSGTVAFSFGADITGSYHPTANLTDPEGTPYNYHFETTGERIIENPVAGLWHLTINKPSREGRFWFNGIPPLCWHNPDYLLIQE